MGKGSQGRRSSNTGSRGTPVAEHTAPMSGLKDVCFARGEVMKEAVIKLWRRTRKIDQPGMEKSGTQLVMASTQNLCRQRNQAKTILPSLFSTKHRVGVNCLEYEEYEESIDSWEGNHMFMYKLVLQNCKQELLAYIKMNPGWAQV